MTRPRVWNPERVGRGTKRYHRYLQKSVRANMGCRCCDTRHERKMQGRYKRERLMERLSKSE